MLLLSEGKCVKPRNLTKSNALSEIWERYVQNNFFLVYKGLNVLRNFVVSKEFKFYSSGDIKATWRNPDQRNS
jgi:hypothetical protein